MPSNLWRNLWRGLGSLTVPPQVSENSIILAVKPASQHSLKSPVIRPKVSVSRHVAFTPSTLDHQEHRRVVRQAEPSAFQNFLREMFDGYYELKLSEERRQRGWPADQPLGSRRLAFDDLVQLHKVANDMWQKMNAQRKQKYKQLAKEAVRRRSLRLPPDPFRIPPNIKKSHKKHSKTTWFVQIKACNEKPSTTSKSLCETKPKQKKAKENNKK